MDPKDKDATRERASRNFQHWLTHEERREQKQRSKQRRANAPRKRPRQRSWSEDDEADEVEAMASGRGRGAGPRGAPGPSGTPSGTPSETRSGAPAGGVSGTVVSVAPARVTVRTAAGEVVAKLSFELARSQSASVAVGDEVTVTGEGPAALVAHVVPRRSFLARPDPGHPHRELVLAANVDLAVVCLSVVAPPLRPALVDRFLVALEYGGVEAALCVNKCDLFEREPAERERVERVLAPYRDLGVPCLVVSATAGTGVDELAELLRGRTSVFVGHSGVGKSSLLNALDPDGARDTGGVREGDGKGRHTTTGSAMRDLGGVLGEGTRVVDTPGVRQFGLWAVDPETLRRTFRELDGPSESCRFRDCSHVHEPDCGVRAAVEAGDVARSRFEAYLRLVEELR